MNAQLSATQKESVSHIAGLVLVNAMIFQEILSDHDQRVRSLQKILAKSNVLNEFASHWQFIIGQINYYPIFHLAHELITTLTANKDVMDSLRRLAQTAQEIVDLRAALHHDLMGRVYHRLLAEAKYLGTYYTSIPAATLLLKLALRANAWEIEWNELDELRKFTVADLACGTGTLLMASADALTDNYVAAAAAREQKVNVAALHTVLAECVIHGYDVLASAIHLTASTLAMRAPQVSFERMNLNVLPLGGADHRLGSIEFLEGGNVGMASDLFGGAQATRVTATGDERLLSAALPQLDLCVMNPPFTRSVGGNLLFGSVPEDERAEMQKRLKKLASNKYIFANVTAGLGSVFVAAANNYVKRNGRLALVLPKALLSGVAWGETRQLINRNYRIEFLIASQDPARWNFSESTDLSEVLLIAQKLDGVKTHKEKPVVAVNLWRNPTTSFESLTIAHALTHDTPPDLVDGQGALEICLGEKKMGEAVAFKWSELKTRAHWLLPAAFAQSDLMRAAYHLERGKLWLPGRKTTSKLPLCPLGELGTLGPDARDVHDAFKVSKSSTAYPAFWGHNADEVLTIAQKPNNFLIPLAKAKPGRHLRRAEDIWQHAGNMLMAERLRLNSQRLLAVRLTRDVLSSTWWEFSFKKDGRAKQKQKAFVLWLNSTFGLLLLLANREETEGAWVKFKKPTLAALPVLDLRALSVAQLKQLAAAYDRVAEKELQPIPQMATDAVRAEIDASIARALRLPDFAVLREMLAREPVVRMKRL
ncbi:MAG: hypothetical protein FJ009_09860 [Chloroflexi bacterium]|nr:hypothetical protein [Chloroflexota bacterium]